MLDSLKRLLLKLFNINAIEFGSFEFKHHEKQPNAPLAPIKINLRTVNHPIKPGKLTDSLVFDIAVHLIGKIERENIQFDYVAGIPRAGEPFAEIIAKILGKPLLRIEKIDKGRGKRKVGKIISSHPVKPDQKVLVIDDVITKGNSKQETINVFESAGLIIAAIVLFADREEGGMAHYQNLGYRLIAATTITEILDLLLVEKKIKGQIYRECLDYLELSRANI